MLVGWICPEGGHGCLGAAWTRKPVIAKDLGIIEAHSKLVASYVKQTLPSAFWLGQGQKTCQGFDDGLIEGGVIPIVGVM